MTYFIRSKTYLDQEKYRLKYSYCLNQRTLINVKTRLLSSLYNENIVISAGVVFSLITNYIYNFDSLNFVQIGLFLEITKEVTH